MKVLTWVSKSGRTLSNDAPKGSELGNVQYDRVASSSWEEGGNMASEWEQNKTLLEPLPWKTSFCQAPLWQEILSCFGQMAKSFQNDPTGWLLFLAGLDFWFSMSSKHCLTCKHSPDSHGLQASFLLVCLKCTTSNGWGVQWMSSRMNRADSFRGKWSRFQSFARREF